MSNIKTPGVTVQEIATLPASVAPVATAIPAFVGYTESASKDGSSVASVPTRISSLKEYEGIFGGAPDAPTFSAIKVDESNSGALLSMTYADDTVFYLYDSLKLYFTNGGGPCYIVSVGTYSAVDTDNDDSTDFRADLIAGIETLESYDEPTLIVVPDASKCSSNDMAAVYVEALTQCNDLGDRFTIIDVPEGANGAAYDPASGLSSYMGQLGNQYLKYGAAYGPFLKLPGTREYSYTEINTALTDSSDASTTITAINSAGITAIAEAVSDLTKAQDVLDPSSVSFVTTTKKTWAEYYADVDHAVINMDDHERRIKVLHEMAHTFLTELDTTSGVAGTELVDWAIATAEVGGKLEGLVETLWAYKEGLVTGTGFTALSYSPDPFTATAYSEGSSPHANWPTGDFNYALGSVTGDSSIYGNYDGNSAANIQTYYERSAAAFQELFDGFLSVLTALAERGQIAYDNAEAELSAANSLFSSLQDAIAGIDIAVPPSGAIAGIYAAVDRNRGVWKAPANVSVAGIERPTVAINDAEQGVMNVTASGKSVNAIRSFSGQGHLVWGARTLAGNDNEWRYVPVRRFYNFVEESVAKASAFVVFEPNDANTWTKVKGMIENFLNGLWRQGALAGAKPEDAYFVKVGLGETMTPENILNGELIVEIGMAAVRPAEFIILKFSHKLQES